MVQQPTMGIEVFRLSSLSAYVPGSPDLPGLSIVVCAPVCAHTCGHFSQAPLLSGFTAAACWLADWASVNACVACGATRLNYFKAGLCWTIAHVQDAHRANVSTRRSIAVAPDQQAKF